MTGILKRARNAHVGQKNGSHVRELFGYDRFADPGLVKLINDLCAHGFSLFTNFFCPAVKLVSKAREGGKWVRKHGPPITPAQRLPDHSNIPSAQKIKLGEQIKSLNPFILHTAH